MATIKGQNLRLVVNDKCVAGATSCSLHIAATVEDSSTKDDTGDWARNEITGLSWDAQSDAVMLTTEEMPTERHEVGDVIIDRGYFEVCFLLHPGEELTEVINVTGVEYEMSIMNEYTHEPYSEGLQNVTTEDIEVMLVYTSETEGAIGDYDVKITNLFGHQLDTLTDCMRTKRPVTVRLDRTRGVLNRETVTQLLEGKALITDISVTAANRQNTTYSCKLTGTGELEIVDND